MQIKKVNSNGALKEHTGAVLQMMGPLFSVHTNLKHSFIKGIQKPQLIEQRE